MEPHTDISQQNASTLSADTKFFGQALDLDKATSIPDVLNAFFMMALSLGAILAMLRLVYAGYLYTSSDVWGNKSSAKEVIRNAVVGLVMLLSVWLVLNTINPDLLNLNVLRAVKPAFTNGAECTTSTGELGIMNGGFCATAPTRGPVN